MLRGPRIGLAVVCVTAALAGCTMDTQPICQPAENPDEGQGVCFTTRDGWILQGVEVNPNATDQPSVLLVHGLNEQHGQYEPLIDRLGDRGWQVLAMDLRGHGDSINLTSGTQRTADTFRNADLYLAREDLNASQRYLGAPPTFVVGASVGANLALAHAADNSGVQGLVLLSPSMGQGPLSAREPNLAYAGPIFYLASEEDRQSAQAVRTLSDEHPGPVDVQIEEGRAHGTDLLDEATVDRIETWMANRSVTRTGP